MPGQEEVARKPARVGPASALPMTAGIGTFRSPREDAPQAADDHDCKDPDRGGADDGPSVANPSLDRRWHPDMMLDSGNTMYRHLWARSDSAGHSAERDPLE